MAYNCQFNKKNWKRNNNSEFKPTYNPKREPVSPLMTEEQKTSANIQELSYDFACRIVRLFQYLTEDAAYKEFVMSKQAYRSGTSVGAKVQTLHQGAVLRIIHAQTLS